MNTQPNLPADEVAPRANGLFPDLSTLRYNQTAKGGGFDVRVESSGIGVQRRVIGFHPEAWAKFVASPQFEESYKLSMARLLLQQAVDRFN